MSNDARPLAVLVAGSIVDDQIDVSGLVAAGFDVVRRPEIQNSFDEHLLIERLAGAFGVVAGGETYSRAVLSALPELRVVSRVGVGYDRVDVPAATDLGKIVSITPNTIEPAVGEWTLTHMLAVRRRLLQSDRAVRSGQWTLTDLLSPSLMGATVGLVGLGRIGREVAKRLAGFGCTVIAADPVADPAEWRKRGVEIVPFDGLLGRSDVISLHLPLMPSTRHIIGAREIGLMKPSAIVVNTSRGGLIDEAALYSALREGRLAGAGLDTFEQEPLPPGSPLLGLDNVVVSGHVAYATHAAALSSAQSAVDNVLRVARGELPPGTINPEVVARAPLVRVAAASA